MSLLQMSISAAVMISIITVIRAISINRLPKKTFIALWGIVEHSIFPAYFIPGWALFVAFANWYFTTHERNKEY